MYNVVFENQTPECRGVITWSTFKSKAEFEAWYNQKMRSWYKVVRAGVSEEEAIALSSSLQSRLSGLLYGLRQFNKRSRLSQDRG